jgi:small-conductance mechanosensitive channel
VSVFGLDLPQWLPNWQQLLPSVLIFIIGAVLVMLVQRALSRALARVSQHTPMSAETALTLQRVSAGVLWLLLVLLTLRHLGVNVNGLWTLMVSTLAVIGVGLLAVWTMVSNITASFFIWIWRPYELGERIELIPDGIKGRTVDRSLMFTVIREEDGSTLMVPNNLFFQRIIRREPNDGRQSAVERWERGKRQPPGEPGEG